MSAARSLERAGALLDEPHHDGSGKYVLERPDELGGQATVRLRVPRGSSPEQVVLSYDRDGEPRNVAAIVDEETETETWWRASFPAWNPSVRYRWLLSGGGAGYAWVNAMGVAAHDVADADDFVLPVGDTGPDWHLSSVVYEIFPDRFASGGGGVDAPPWAVRRGWDELPTGRGPATPAELFGGDLSGVEQRLDHVESLGANLIYLTPFFPAGSTHRYDSTSFAHVDPLLGGDEALVSLARAAHATRYPRDRRPDAQPHGEGARVVPRGAGGFRRARTFLLLLRRGASARLRVVAGHPLAAEARLAQRGAAAAHRARSRAATSSRRSTSTAGGSTSRTWSAVTAGSTSTETSRGGRGARSARGCCSPSTATTSGPTSIRKAGTAS